MSKDSYRNFLDLDAIEAGELRGIIDQAKKIKTARAGRPKAAIDDGAPLAGHVLAAIFERESTRTRVSFDIGMRQLGGQSLILSGDEMQLGEREPVSDSAAVLSRYADIIMLRTLHHESLLELAAHASVPVINGLTDKTHPCQLMADVMTIEEHRGPIAGKVVAWTGDGNNVAASLVHAAVKFDFELRIATPPGYEVDAEVITWAGAEGGTIALCGDPAEAVEGADCVITDTWVSMGQEGREERLKAFAPFQVNEALMELANADALFLHCLPAHRGEEVSPGVIDGPSSVVWDEAENRLHAQKAILLWCLRRG